MSHSNAAPEARAPSAPTDARRSTFLLAAVLATPVALVAAFGAFWLFGGFDSPDAKVRVAGTSPVVVTAPPHRPADDALCAKLLGALPRTLADASARPVTDAPHRVAAWGDPAIVLRCGVDRPRALTADAQLLIIEGVAWVAEDLGGTVLWTSTSQALHVEVLVPAAYRDKASTEILNPLAAPLKAALPAR